jgi:hypothetical protein
MYANSFQILLVVVVVLVVGRCPGNHRRATEDPFTPWYFASGLGQTANSRRRRRFLYCGMRQAGKTVGVHIS